MIICCCSFAYFRFNSYLYGKDKWNTGFYVHWLCQLFMPSLFFFFSLSGYPCEMEVVLNQLHVANLENHLL